jgi:hypothetical protein
MQSVQRGLLAKETQSKSDDSPVTVADYGTLSIHKFYLTLGYVTLCMCAHNTLTLKLNPKLELIYF